MRHLKSLSQLIIASLLTVTLFSSCNFFDTVDLTGKSYESDIQLTTGTDGRVGHYIITFEDKRTCTIDAEYTDFKYIFGELHEDYHHEYLTRNYSQSYKKVLIDSVYLSLFVCPMLGSDWENHAQEFTIIDEETLRTHGYDMNTVNNATEPEFIFTLVK